MRSVLIALGSNLGDRRLHLRRAIDELACSVRIVRVSSVWETDPVDAPEGSGAFLNMVALGWTSRGAAELLNDLHAIEERMGRRRRRRNEPRIIDLDLVLHGATLRREKGVRVPHPRYLDREFVLSPIGELALRWSDPATGRPLPRVAAGGAGLQLAGSLY